MFCGLELQTPYGFWMFMGFMMVYGCLSVDSFGRPHLVDGIDPPFIAKD
jgi:hypothetical protein